MSGGSTHLEGARFRFLPDTRPAQLEAALNSSLRPPLFGRFGRGGGVALRLLKGSTSSNWISTYISDHSTRSCQAPTASGSITLTDTVSVVETSRSPLRLSKDSDLADFHRRRLNNRRTMDCTRPPAKHGVKFVAMAEKERYGGIFDTMPDKERSRDCPRLADKYDLCETEGQLLHLRIPPDRERERRRPLALTSVQIDTAQNYATYLPDFEREGRRDRRTQLCQTPRT